MASRSLITKKKPLPTPAKENQTDVEEQENVVVTTTGDEISEEQNIIEPTLKEILKLPYENERRYATNNYLLKMILQEDFMKKVYVSHIFQK
jgi:hypothetical protein